MSGMKNTRIHIQRFSAALVFFISLLAVQLSGIFVSADVLLNRSVSISSSFPSEVVNHTYGLQTVNADSVQSMQFLYCSNSPLIDEVCTAPTGLNVASAVLAGQFGITGFSVSGASNANTIVMNRAPSVEPPTASIYSFDNVTNPSGSNQVVYVRIVVTTGIDATGTLVDDGAVAFVTEEPFDINAYVPPYLTFCAAVTVALDCSSSEGFLADFGEFNSDISTAVTSQMSVATNDGTGYNAFITGQTMTSGTNIIPALAAQTTSIPGTSQFGINLRANSSPSVGSNPELGPVASGVPDANYNTPNQFRFVNGERVASAPISTGFNRYTISYLVNVAADQAPGLYATTLTYTAVASF